METRSEGGKCGESCEGGTGTEGTGGRNDSANMEGFFENAAPSWYFPNFFNAMVKVLLELPRSWIQFHKPLAAAFANMDACFSRIQELKAESEANMTLSRM